MRTGRNSTELPALLTGRSVALQRVLGLKGVDVRSKNIVVAQLKARVVVDMKPVPDELELGKP